MKKYKSIAKAVLLSCTLALTTSCNDFLDKAPDDQLTMEMIFTDKIRTEDWLAGVYSSIPSPMWGYFKAQGYNIMGDDITIPQDWSPYGWSNVYAYTTGNWSPISTWDPYYWVELHKRIRSGLIFLQEAKVLPEKDLKESYVNQMKYEVRFLIAYYYSLMIELYGAIPFTPGVLVSVDAPESEMMTPQRPYAEVVDCVDKVTTKKRNAERYSDRIELQGFQSCFRLFVKPSQSPLKPNQDAATLLVRNHARNGDKRTRITKQGVKD